MLALPSVCDGGSLEENIIKEIISEIIKNDELKFFLSC